MDWSLFDEFEPKINKFINKCKCYTELIELDGHMTCTSCGSVFEQMFYNSYETIKTIKHKIPYKRKSHFRVKLLEIQGKLIPPSWLIEQCKNKHLNSIHEIKNYLESNKLSKYNKYVYYIHEKINNEILFKFTSQKEEKYYDEFMYIDRKFSKFNNNPRNNLFSYYFVMYKILSNDGYKNIENKLFFPRGKQTNKTNNKLWNMIFN